MTTVLLTDRAWPDDWVEREVLESAGLRLVAGPPAPADAATIDAVVAEPQPEADPHLLGTGIGQRSKVALR
jgi:D-3-phosphoglycerate dehydrogenase